MSSNQKSHEIEESSPCCPCCADDHDHDDHDHDHNDNHDHDHEDNDHEDNDHNEDHDHSHDHGHGCGCSGEGHASGKNQLIWLIIGAVAFTAGIIYEHFLDIAFYYPLAIYIIGYLILGGDVVLRAGRNILRGKVFDESFLIAIATIGAFVIGEYAEAVAVMLFYQVGEYFQDLAVGRSKKNIAKLMDIRPDYANLLQDDGSAITVSPETVKIGDLIIVKPGERIPLDGLVKEGSAMLDTSALTGESVPRSAKVSDKVLSGSVNQNGVLTIQVTEVYGQSTVSKIIDLVENAAARKAPTEKFITKFAGYYTPIVVGLATLLAVIPPLFGGDWYEWIHRGLVFLVISCPCALVISIPLSFFGGISGASRKGILVKGGNYLEALNYLDTVVFDKTGTLTKGVFNVTEVHPAEGYTRDELLETAAFAEAYSNHPIALSILWEYDKDIDKAKLSGYTEIAGHGVRVDVDGNVVLAGNNKLMNSNEIVFTESENVGTKVYIASGGNYMGYIIISDEVKPDSREAISSLKAMGVRKTVMLTGDNKKIADALANELGIDEVYSELLPQEKVEKLELLGKQKNANGKLAFVGDGINDAPALAMADIGVAMGALGSDAAIEAADVVLMTDEPGKLPQAVKVAKFTKRIVWQNIVFALGVKSIFLVLGAFGVASMWEAVFADVGVALLAVFNAMRVMRAK